MNCIKSLMRIFVSFKSSIKPISITGSKKNNKMKSMFLSISCIKDKPIIYKAYENNIASPPAEGTGVECLLLLLGVSINHCNFLNNNSKSIDKA